MLQFILHTNYTKIILAFTYLTINNKQFVFIKYLQFTVINN